MASSDAETLPAAPGPAPRWTPVLSGGLWTLSFLAFVLGRTGRLPFEVALFGIAAAGLVALGMGLWAAYQHWGQRQVADNALLAAAPLGVLVLALAAWTSVRFPWLHDVAAAERPPTFRWLAPADPGGADVYDEAQAQTLRARYPSLQPVRLSSRPERAFGHAVVAAGGLPGWHLERMSQRERRFEGTTRTRLGFESQIVVTVRPEKTGSVLEVRSRSNIATGDFGENARTIQRFLKLLGQTWMCKPPADFAAKRG